MYEYPPIEEGGREGGRVRGKQRRSSGGRVRGRKGKMERGREGGGRVRGRQGGRGREYVNEGMDVREQMI